MDIRDAYIQKLELDNSQLREEIGLLNLRIKKLEAVNLPVIVHCNCEKPV